MKRWIALLALAAVVCGAAPGVAAAATATTRTAHVNAAQLSLAYPKAWTVVPYKRKEMLAQRKALAKRNPQLADAFDVESTKMVARTTKFHAVDLDAQLAGKPSANVSVSVVPGSGFPPSLESFRTVFVPGLKSRGATDVQTSTTKLRGRSAYRLEARMRANTVDGAPLMGHLGQLMIEHPAGAAIVTVVAFPGMPTDPDVLIDDILASVRVT